MNLIVKLEDLKDGELPVNKIICGNVLDALKKLPSNSIDCIITSPPYWGLRFYGEQANTIWGGDPNCEHEWEFEEIKGQTGGKTEFVNRKGKENFKEVPNTYSAFCKKCGAWYGQLGLEPTLDMYIEHMLEITAELKRVLKPTGVFFLNHGDNWENKNLMMQNFRLAMRMVDEQGWILRNIIIWHKPNHMPESVKDRFTKSYEPVFMFVKNKKYWFDLDAVREPHKTPLEALNKRIEYDVERKGGKLQKAGIQTGCWSTNPREINPLGRNPGDVWEIPTQPFSAKELGFEDVDHFAVFPPKLVERMIKCGCPQWVCKKCGFIRERITKTELMNRNDNIVPSTVSSVKVSRAGDSVHYTIGWTSCECNA